MICCRKVLFIQFRKNYFFKTISDRNVVEVVASLAFVAANCRVHFELSMARFILRVSNSFRFWMCFCHVILFFCGHSLSKHICCCNSRNRTQSATSTLTHNFPSLSHGLYIVNAKRTILQTFWALIHCKLTECRQLSLSAYLQNCPGRRSMYSRGWLMKVVLLACVITFTCLLFLILKEELSFLQRSDIHSPKCVLLLSSLKAKQNNISHYSGTTSNSCYSLWTKNLVSFLNSPSQPQLNLDKLHHSYICKPQTLLSYAPWFPL